MKLLFITSTRIGDAVLSTALLSHLIERYPEAEITIACGPAAAPLFATSFLIAKRLTETEASSTIVAFLSLFVTLTLLPAA
ncbi:MAG: hypothetical protein QF767_08665, partial [Alphaproteobacteria bacterium]|nr:hypothetical protein [Alphaproteobacteria bacterium]